VKAYLDSGVFIDFLVGRSHAGPFLRSSARRGREPSQLGKDAEACLERLSLGHVILTSSLTCYEVEEAFYRELKRSAIVAQGDRFLIPAARALITQTLTIIDLFGIEVVDLTSAIVTAQCQNIELQKRGIRAADSLHVTTAVLAGADLLITADDDLLRLDRVFSTAGGVLRCVDSDDALSLIR